MFKTATTKNFLIGGFKVDPGHNTSVFDTDTNVESCTLIQRPRALEIW